MMIRQSSKESLALKDSPVDSTSDSLPTTPPNTPILTVRNPFARSCLYKITPPTNSKIIGFRTVSKVYQWMASLCYVLDFSDWVLYTGLGLMRDFLTSHNNQYQVKRLQLLGACCLLLSSKYHGGKKRLTLQTVNELLLNQFSTDEILEMEADILKAVDYDMERQTLWWWFMEHRQQNDEISKESLDKIQFWLLATTLYHEHKLTEQEMFEKLFDAASSKLSRSALLTKIIQDLRICKDTILIKKFSKRFDVESYLRSVC